MPDNLENAARSNRFATTSWTLVLRAGGRGVEQRLAFEDLCLAYWYPLFAFARRKGYSVQDSEDAVQSFLSWMFEAGVVERADPERGRFRSFLITAFKNYLRKQYQIQSAQKRRPANPIISIDVAFGEERYLREPADLQTPETQFERAWAWTVMQRAEKRLQEEWIAAGKGARFEAFKDCLTGTSADRGRGLAQKLSMTEGAVRVAIHRLKSRFAEILRQEVAGTLDSDDEVEEELTQLLAAISAG